MKISELVEASNDLPVSYVPPAPEEVPGGRAATITPEIAKQIVKANKLVTTPQAIAALRSGKVPTPIVQKVGSGWNVLAHGDVIAAMSTAPNKAIKVVTMPPNFVPAQPATNAVPGQQGAQQPGMKTGGTTISAQQKTNQPGLVAQAKGGYNAGSNAARNLAYKVQGAVNSFTNVGR
jgi:hypothetical protein